MQPDCGDVPVSALQGFTDTVVLLVPPNTDRVVQIDADELALVDSRIDEVLVLSLKICDPSVHSYDLDIGISNGDTKWLCLLHSASSGNAWGGDNSFAARVGCRGLDHWKGVVWDPGIMGQQYLLVCYDCLCLMALCRDAMLLAHDWAALSMWTVTETGYV